MAEREHLQYLIAAIASGECREWNDWRMTHSDLLPDLAAVDIRDVKLPFANFSRTDLRGADLSGTDLSHADLRHADLSLAVLRHTNLSRADLRGANLSHADLRDANLFRANLVGADLTHAELSGANLKGSGLVKAGAGRDSRRASRRVGTSLTQPERGALGLFKRKAVNANLMRKTQADRPAARKDR